jgi:ABC-2 type transport system ATP-binding protein
VQQTEADAGLTPATGRRECAIEVKNLVKTYGSVRAVDGLTFSVGRGEIFALLGPNGAGKTTTVEILEGYRKADSGEARVLGLDPVRQGMQMKQRIGLMLQQTALYQRIKVREATELFCGYYERPRVPGDLIQLVGLEEQVDTYFQDLSGGQKQRLSLALALAGNPEVAFLDEPTGSMDPRARLQTWDVITHLKTQGVTVLLTTHYMEEAQRLADRVAIIDHGRLVALGTPQELTISGTEVITFRGPERLRLPELESLQNVTAAREDHPGAYSLATTDAIESVAALAQWRRQTGVEISELRVSGASLEDVFLDLTDDEVRV